MRYESYAKMLVASLGSKPADLVLKNGNIVDVFGGRITRGDIAICDNLIVGIGNYNGLKEIDMTGKTITPGFIDGHLHIESSMLTPGHFISIVNQCGTTTLIADPHEIVNVMGSDGIRFMLDETEDVKANIFFMLPSCVPATVFESNGYPLSAEDMARYKSHPRILGLAEVMDYPSVINASEEMYQKIELFRNRMIDGHAPGLSGKKLQAYRMAGVKSDHECTDFDEVLEKLSSGMWIHIREGSAAKNLEAIVKGIVENQTLTNRFMMCTDDKSSEEIELHGHISDNIRKAIALGLDPVKAISMATINTANCYGLEGLGAIAPGYQADLVVLDDLTSVQVSEVYFKGQRIEKNSRFEKAKQRSAALTQSVHLPPLTAKSFAIKPKKEAAPVISLLPYQITTKMEWREVPLEDGFFKPNNSFNKIAVIERHHQRNQIGLGIIEGFQIKNGAIASTVAHDSHNLIAVGDNDADLLLACEELKKCGGGYTVIKNGKVAGTMPLPIAGLMTDEPPKTVQKKISEMIEKARQIGVPASVDPFITLSFMALPVIPALRLTDKGLFDATLFEFVDWL